MKHLIAINFAADQAHVDIAVRGPIHDLAVSHQSIADALTPAVESVTVRINSLGGQAHQGIGIYNTLRDHPARVDVIVEGVAGSAGSVIAMAADPGKLAMANASLMMIHACRVVDPATGEDVEGHEKMLAAYNTALVEIYRARTGKSEGEIRRLLEAETWMSAREAVDAKFADTIQHTPAFGAPHNLTEALAIACGDPRLALAFNRKSKPGLPEIWKRAIASVRPEPFAS